MESKNNGLKVVIEIKAQEIWMKQESEMSLMQWFYLHYPSDKPKIVIDTIEYVYIKFMYYPLILNSIIFY